MFIILKHPPGDLLRSTKLTFTGFPNPKAALRISERVKTWSILLCNRPDLKPKEQNHI